MTTDARNVLVAELLGEVDTLLKRVENIAPDIAGVHARLVTTSAEMSAGAEKFRQQVTALSEAAQKSAVNHIVRRTNEVCEGSLAAHTDAMRIAAKTALEAEIGPRIDALASTFDEAMHRAAAGSGKAWLMPLAAAITASAVTALVMAFVFSR